MNEPDRLPDFLLLMKWAGMAEDEAKRRRAVGEGLAIMPTENPQARRAAVAMQERLAEDHRMLAEFLEWCARRAKRLYELNQRPRAAEPPARLHAPGGPP